MGEFLCNAGPADHPFEESHSEVSIAFVLEGDFQYRCPAGSASLVPGAVLLGNAGCCFECGHEHGTGDRCVYLHLTPDFFAEIAASIAGSSHYRFFQPALPAAASLVPLAARLETLPRRAGRETETAELAVRVAETVIGLASGAPPVAPRVSSRDSRRVGRAIRHIERHFPEPIDLDGLAAAAAMSKYHFIRVFRGMTGMTPYQYALTQRLRRAAVRLADSSETVAAIAFDSGFGDLSTFNARFRAVFGKSPRAFRRE